MSDPVSPTTQASETIGWGRATLTELMSDRDQIASDRRCEQRAKCATSSTVFRGCACMQSAVQRMAMANGSGTH